LFKTKCLFIPKKSDKSAEHKKAMDAMTSAAKRPRWADSATVEVTVQLGLAGRTVAVAVPETMRVSDLRAQLALASPDFEHVTWKMGNPLEIWRFWWDFHGFLVGFYWA
jgi:hypothetical protein